MITWTERCEIFDGQPTVVIIGQREDARISYRAFPKRPKSAIQTSHAIKSITGWLTSASWRWLSMGVNEVFVSGTKNVWLSSTSSTSRCVQMPPPNRQLSITIKVTI